MNNPISVESLAPVSHAGVSVITTELLAQLYGTEAARIRKNHQRNASRFIEGKHFYKVTGSDLENLRVSLRHSQNQSTGLRLSSSESQNPISPKTRALILWTERGAARHAKMLETDQAWEVFEKLEDHYFTKGEVVKSRANKNAYQPAPIKRYQAIVIIRDAITGNKARLDGDADTLKGIAEGIATELGYEPVKTIVRSSAVLKVLSE